MGMKELTSNISLAVALVSSQAVVGEAGPGHQPGSLAGDLGVITVGIA